MSSERQPDSDEAESMDADSDETVADLRTRLELLREENDRLRAEYRRVRQVQYRRTALGLLTVAVVAGLGGLVIPAVQQILFVLAGIGAFGAVLTYFITPERFVAASVTDGIYGSLAATGSRIVSDLGLTHTRVYVPVGEDSAVRLFVPQHAEYAIPPADSLDGFVVVPETERKRGIAVAATGQSLYDAFTDGVPGQPATSPGPLAEQLADAIVGQFELANAVDIETGTGDGRVDLRVRGSVLGAVDRFDHPIPSLVATGLARVLDRPIEVEVTDAADTSNAYVVSCQWDPAD